MTRPGFEKVAPVVDFPQAEARIRQLWRDADIFRKSLARRRGGPRFVFYEVPTANRHAPQRARAHARDEGRVPPLPVDARLRRASPAGWDTHGLAVEIEVEGLRISGRDAISPTA
jgi:isoleucyl-tRNA synthetase